MNLPILRDDFDTTDYNRNMWYGHVIPKTIFIFGFIGIIILLSYFDWYKNPISLHIAGVIAMLLAIMVKNTIRKNLPDVVHDEDIIGRFVIANDNIEIHRKSKQSVIVQKHQVEKVIWKHNYSKEFRFNSKDDHHNGLSTIDLILEKNTPITFKIDIQSTRDLLALYEYFQGIPETKTIPRLDRWTREKLRNSLE